ncbi:hypothetical protein AYI69_g1677 [Smittium culicis]|uniref:Uncharacterized protein n=1 Tax=Smittium culicis TaxID=133412 RepID=A0A1R1YPK9_9FUNG|nr:hypothetical protein AYI69_g1677 [Smittium culicis]
MNSNNKALKLFNAKSRYSQKHSNPAKKQTIAQTYDDKQGRIYTTESSKKSDIESFDQEINNSSHYLHSLSFNYAHKWKTSGRTSAAQDLGFDKNTNTCPPDTVNPEIRIPFLSYSLGTNAAKAIPLIRKQEHSNTKEDTKAFDRKGYSFGKQNSGSRWSQASRKNANKPQYENTLSSNIYQNFRTHPGKTPQNSTEFQSYLSN